MSKVKLALVLDLETTAVCPSAGILAIAAVPCLTEYHLDSFYCTIKFDEAFQYDEFVVDENTMNWHYGTPEAVREHNLKGENTIEDALKMFSEYLINLQDNFDVHLVGNSARFDCGILADAFRIVLDKRNVWDWRKEVCYRTLKNTFSQVSPPPALSDMQKHIAIYDARWEATHLEYIDKLAKLKLGKGVL